LTGPAPSPGGKAVDLDAVAPTCDKSVLLVDDDDLNQEVIGELLTSLGWKVELVSDGAEALERVRRANEEQSGWDVILMDVRMPVMDGPAATRAIRALGTHAASIPIIALTGASDDAIQECRSAGMDDHIAKPVKLPVLETMLNRWGGKTGGTRSPAAHAANSLAQRFEARCRDSAQRLEALVKELGASDSETARPLLCQAENLAHVMAGTAGLFGHAELGTIASQVEQELGQFGSARGPSFEQAPFTAPLTRLKEALWQSIGPRPGEPDSHGAIAEAPNDLSNAEARRL
jgi:CheY-like chemotaxis protein